MTHPAGFTLIELMIVVAIIAIIAAIAIPSLIRSKIAANETSAISGLKMLVSTQSVWRQTDVDGNGVRDYLTHPPHVLSSFYNQTNKNGDPSKLIDIAFSKSDLESSGADYPKSGYLFYTINLDEDGTPYERKARYKFAFAAGPANYGSTGVRSFIVNESGVVYSNDTGPLLLARGFEDSGIGPPPTSSPPPTFTAPPPTTSSPGGPSSGGEGPPPNSQSPPLGPPPWSPGEIVPITQFPGKDPTGFGWAVED